MLCGAGVRGVWVGRKTCRRENVHPGHDVLPQSSPDAETREWMKPTQTLAEAEKEPEPRKRRGIEDRRIRTRDGGGEEMEDE